MQHGEGASCTGTAGAHQHELRQATPEKNRYEELSPGPTAPSTHSELCSARGMASTSG